MVLTKKFRDTVLARAKEDSEFRKEMLTEAVNQILSGDIELGKTLLRDFINATVSFGLVADALGKNSKSIQRMLSPKGNPTMENLIKLLKVLQDREGVQFRVVS
ncbi:MAG: transcriptional regulator [Magnetococcales bacterium]|nr:transcriptional regulator [Magnetococcales bacterium]